MARIKLVFDACTWILALHGHDPPHALLKRCLQLPESVTIIVNSYCLLEVLSVLKKTTHQPVEKHFWGILNSPTCVLDFELPLSRDLMKTVRKKTEIVMLAKLLDLEPKDVPYLVLSFKHRAHFVTEDVRSIHSKKKRFQETLPVMIIDSSEALLLVRKFEKKENPGNNKSSN